MEAQATLFASASQFDLSPVVVEPVPTPVCQAKQLGPHQRQDLALQIVVGIESVAGLAQEHHVSRKFLYQQAEIAKDALNEAFDPKSKDEKVLFYLPVTKAWLRQLVLALVLVCHSSLRGVVELIRDLFDWSISLGTVHNIVQSAVEPARKISNRYHLGGVLVGAHDEIFQANRPVLVGVDTDTTFCYLLTLEEHRDSETWGVRLLELAERGFAPHATVADGGTALRAGQDLALPHVPCRGDVFHAFRDLEQLTSFLVNRAYNALEQVERCRRQFEAAQRRAKSVKSAAQQLRRAGDASDVAVTLYDEVALLVRWLRSDVLSVAGPCYADRCMLYDFVVDELERRVPLCPHRLGPICRLLRNQRDDLLAFARAQDQELEALGRQFQVPTEVPRQLLRTMARDMRDWRRWTEELSLRERLGDRFHALQVAVAALAERTVRASSLVENVNSRLRSYFFLRRHLGADYLALLQFFLNHRRLERSERPERAGKTPAELMTGQPHRHWLEMLGYTRFTRS